MQLISGRTISEIPIVNLVRGIIKASGIWKNGIDLRSGSMFNNRVSRK